MSFPTRTLFLCVSLALLLEVAYSSTTTSPKADIELDQCDDKTLSLKAGNGFYYSMEKSGPKRLPDPANGVLTITRQNTQPIKILRVDTENLLDKNSVFYEVNCGTGIIKTVDALIKVRKAKEKIIDIKFNQTAKMVFKKSNQEIHQATVGDEIEMEIKSDSGKNWIEIKECKAIAGKSQIILYDPKKKKLIGKDMKPGVSATLKFDAFRFVDESTKTLKFECSVKICPANKACADPPTGAVPYDLEQDIKNAQVEGLLTVYLPYNTNIENAAERGSSHVRNVLLTLGAVVLQRQFS